MPNQNPAAEGSGAVEALRQRGLAILRPCTRSLAEMARDQDSNVALPAITALGKIGDPLAIDVCFALLENEAVAEEAIAALARFREPGVVAKLVDIVSRSVPKVTAAAAQALGHFPSAQVLKALLPLAKHSFPPVRSAALASLGRIADPAAVPILLETLEDPDPAVVIDALKALRTVGVRGQPAVVPRLVQLYQKLDNPKVRASLLQVLHGVNDETILELAKNALKDANPRVRANAVELIHSLADLQPRRKLSLLKPLVAPGQNNRVQANVAIALGKVDTATSVQILSSLLNSAEKWERASAVYAARFIQNERVAGWLTTLFTSEEDPDVLRNVLDSLAAFRGDEVTACFVRALDHTNPLVRSGAAKSLGRIGDVNTADQLVKLLENEQDRSVICETLTALGRLGDASRIAMIAGFMQHTDLRVQANAIEALQAIGTVEIVPYVEPFLNSSDNRVKANAAVAMWNAGSLQVVTSLRDMLKSVNLKLKVSAIYAIGEIGKSLQELSDLKKYFLLVSALKEESPESFENLSVKSLAIPAPAPDGAAAGAGPSTAGASRPRPSDEISPYEITQSFLVTTEGDRTGFEFPMEVIEQFLGLLKDQKVKEAMDVLEAGLQLDRENVYLHYLQADLQRRQKKLAVACDGFVEVNRRDRFFLNAHLHLASIYADSQELRQSLEEYFRAVLVQLHVLQQEIETGLRLLKDRQVNEASLLLKSVVKQLPIDSKLHFVAGREFLKYKAHEQAFEHLTKAYLSSPSNGEVLLSLAFASFKTSRYKMARLVCKKLQQLFPGETLLSRKAAELIAVMDKTGV